MTAVTPSVRETGVRGTDVPATHARRPADPRPTSSIRVPPAGRVPSTG